MLRKLRERINEEKGFTLIELLVVILIIGILAAIALPAFLGQQEKGQDSEAKSNARNLVSQLDSGRLVRRTNPGMAQAIGFTPDGQLRYALTKGPELTVGLLEERHPLALDAPG